MREDMIHGCDFDTVILVLWRTPANTSFEFVFTKHRNTEDMRFNVLKEGDIVFDCTNSQLLADVFQEVDMTDLYNDMREDIRSCLLDCWVVITCYRDQWVIHVPKLREELLPCLKAF